MINVKDNLFMLETDHTSYWFHITDTGLPEHLYYGPSVYYGSSARAGTADCEAEELMREAAWEFGFLGGGAKWQK